MSQAQTQARTVIQFVRRILSTNVKLGLLEVCLLMISSVIALGLGELVIRSFRPQATASYLYDSLGRYYTASEFNSFTLVKNYVGTEPSQEYPGKRVRVTTNSLGLRGREVSSWEIEMYERILVLGDSYTFGVYVNDDETYPSVLERLLRAEARDSLVLNAGYADGFETDEEYCWFVNVGKRLKPQVVILGLFAGNDIMGIRPEFWVETNSKGLPIRIKNPYLSIDNGILRSTELNYHTVGADWVYGVPFLRCSHLCVYLSVRANILVAKLGLQQRYRDPEISNPHLFKKSKSSDEFDRKEAIFLRLVRAMRDEVHAANGEFLVLMIPHNFEVEPQFFNMELPSKSNLAVTRDYYGELQEKLKSEGIPYINLKQEMRQQSSEKYFPRNCEPHFNPAGHTFTASRLKAYLTSHGWLKR